jgi:hypothetical protein
MTDSATQISFGALFEFVNGLTIQPPVAAEVYARDRIDAGVTAASGKQPSC